MTPSTRGNAAYIRAHALPEKIATEAQKANEAPGRQAARLCVAGEGGELVFKVIHGARFPRRAI
jgi:hypothetical protein